VATNTEVAGISIGITADIAGLDSSLGNATQKVDNWTKRIERRKVQVTVDAVKGESWGNIESDLNALVKRVTAGHSVPINVDLHLEDPQAEKARLEGIVKQAIGGLKIPLEIDYKAKAHVEVTWSWADGKGPGGNIGGAPGGSPGTQQGTTSRGRRTATGQSDATSPSPQSAPQQSGSKVTATQQPRQAPAPEEPTTGGGIANMSTATPKTRAQKAKEEQIAANTVAASEASAEAAREWRTVTRSTFMSAARREIPGLESLNPRLPRGASGFEAEYAGRTPTGNVRFVTEDGLRTLLRSSRPGTFAGIRPVEGRVTTSRRPDYDDPRRGLGDMRSMAWFNPGGGFDPEVRAHSKALFDEAMAKREDEVFAALGDVIEQRQGETPEEFKTRLMRDWTFSFMGGPERARSPKAIQKMAKGLQMSPEVEELEGKLKAGDFGGFFGDPMGTEGGARGALQMRAEAMALIRARRVASETQKAGRPLTEQERKAALSKGTQRARRLRSEGALPDPERPEEAEYVALNSMIGQAFAQSFFAEQDLKTQQATAQGKETRHYRAAVEEFSKMHGRRPAGEPPPGSPPETLGAEDWDALFNDFIKTYELPRPKPRTRGRRGGPASAVGETNRQARIAALREEMEQQEAFEQFGDPQYNEKRLSQLQDILANASMGDYSGLEGAKRRTTRERGLTGPHRRLSEEVRANTGFCQYCGTMFTGRERGHADHAIPRAQGGGVESLTSACSVCNELKGDKGLLEFLQDPNRRAFSAVDPRQARAHMEERFPNRLWDNKLDLSGSSLSDRIKRGPQPQPGQPTPPPPPKEEPFIPVWRRRDQSGVRQPRIEGSARRTRAELEGLGGVPIDVPDVRDIASAMGLGRGGFGTSGIRTKITAGSRAKMQRLIKGAEVEKVFALIGDRYVDEAGRVLNDVREVIELETDPSKTSAKTFGVGAAGLGKLRSRVERTGQSFLGMVHGIEGHGLGLSEPGRSAGPNDDASVLARLSGQIPGFLSGIIDPGTKEGMRLYGQGASGPVQRSYNIAGNIPRMAPEPAQAQAASPVAEADLDRQFNSLPEEAKGELVRRLQASGQPEDLWPSSVRTWAGRQNAYQQPQQAQMGQMAMFDPAAVAAGQMGASPFRWNLGAAGVGVNVGQRMVNVGAAGPASPVGGGGPPPGQGGFGFAGAPGGFGPGGGGRGSSGLSRLGRYSRGPSSVQAEAIAAGVDPALISRIESQSRNQTEGTLEFVAEQQSEIQERLASTPVRALSTAIGQFVAQRVARGPATAKARQAGILSRAITRAGRIAGEQRQVELGTEAILRQERATGIDTRTGQAFTPEREAQLESERQVAQKRRVRAEQLEGRLRPELEDAVKGVAPLRLQIANLAALTPAIVAGGLIFQAAMGLAQAGLDALGKIAGEGAETLTGFNATTKRVQEQLAQAAQERGTVSGAVAGGFAQAGFEPTAEQRALIEGQVGAVVATNRAVQQRDLLRMMENLRTQAPNAQEFGIAPGLVRPTGGLFGTAIGAQQSLDEIIGNEFERIRPQGPTGAFTAFDEGVRGFFDDLMGRPNVGEMRDKAFEGFADNMNRELAQVGQTARFEPGTPMGLGLPNQEQFQQAALLDTLGANELAAAVRDGSVALRDANGEMVMDVEDLAGIVKDLGKALEMPSGRESYRANERQRNAAMMQIQDQFQNQTRLTGPITDFRRFALNRPLPFGTTFDTGDAASGRARAAFGGAAQDAMAAITARRAQGRAAAIEIGVSPQDLSRLEAYGDQIASIRGDLMQRQLAVNTAAYNQQLTVARRTLSDLVGLTGQVGDAQASAVGLAERENLELQRANTLISRRMQARQLDMSQRQINFSLATSQFTTSGATPAEAAAKMEQARIEAQFAQANLNDQRDIFKNEGVQFENQITIVDEQNLRALQDAVFAIQQIERERDLEKYTAAGEEYLGMLQDEADILAQEIDAQIGRGMNFVTLAQDEIRRVYVESGEILTGVTEDIADAFEQIREDYDTWLGDVGNQVPLNNTSGTNTRDRSAGDSPTGGGYATGGLFSTSGAQTITVGEAGNETVAVLRNPRHLLTSEAGGGGMIQININNPSVRNDSDIEAIARAVEETLRQRANLVRPR